jgi:hypothetical protein
MNDLAEIKKSVLTKNVIGEAEVKHLREMLFTDGAINKEKANLLFELKDAFLNKNNHSTWKPFFIDFITEFLPNDEESPGEIDDSEAKWLRAKIQHDGKLGKIDKTFGKHKEKEEVNK